MPARDVAVPVVIEALRMVVSSGDIETASLVFETIVHLSKDSACRADLFRKGAADAFVAALRRTEADVGSAHNGIVAVRVLSSDAASREALAVAGAGASIIALLLHKSARTPSAAAACSALRVLAGRESEPGARAAVLEGGAAAGLVAALGERKGDADAITEVCTVVWDLSRCPDARTALGRSGIMPALIAVLQVQKGSAAVAHPACSALAELIMDDAASRLEMHACAGAGIAAVIDVLKHSQDDAKAVSSACVLLSRVGMDRDALPRLARDAAPIVVLAMKRHAADAIAVRNAMAVLNNCLNDQAQKALVFRAGALTAVLEAMELHKADGPLCERGCSVVQSFLDPEWQAAEVKRTLRREGGIGKQMAQALRAHAAMPVLALQASYALANLARDAKGPQRAALLRDGAAQALVAGLKENMKNVSLIGAACSAISVLADEIGSDAESAALLARAAVTAPVVAALRSGLSLPGPAADEAVGYACRALESLMRIPGEAALIARLGCLADVVKALVRLKAEAKPVAACSSILGQLAASPDAQPALLRCSAVAAATDAIAAQESDSRMVTIAASIMVQRGFAGAPVSREGAVTLVRALTRHKADAGCYTMIGMAMQMLAVGNEENKALFLSEVRCRNGRAAALYSLTELAARITCSLHFTRHLLPCFSCELLHSACSCVPVLTLPRAGHHPYFCSRSAAARARRDVRRSCSQRVPQPS